MLPQGAPESAYGVALNWPSCVAQTAWIFLDSGSGCLRERRSLVTRREPQRWPIVAAQPGRATATVAHGFPRAATMAHHCGCSLPADSIDGTSLRLPARYVTGTAQRTAPAVRLSAAHFCRGVTGLGGVLIIGDVVAARTSSGSHRGDTRTGGEVPSPFCVRGRRPPWGTTAGPGSSSAVSFPRSCRAGQHCLRPRACYRRQACQGGGLAKAAINCAVRARSQDRS